MAVKHSANAISIAVLYLEDITPGMYSWSSESLSSSHKSARDIDIVRTTTVVVAVAVEYPVTEMLSMRQFCRSFPTSLHTADHTKVIFIVSCLHIHTSCMN